MVLSDSNPSARLSLLFQVFYDCVDVLEKKGEETQKCGVLIVDTPCQQNPRRENTSFSCFNVTIVLLYCQRENCLMNLQRRVRPAQSCID